MANDIINIENYISKLEDIKISISKLFPSFESNFMDIGGESFKCLEESQNLFNISNNIIESFVNSKNENDKILVVYSQLKKMSYDESIQILENLESQIKSVDKIFEQLRDIFIKLNGIIKYFSILAVNTKIESGRLKNDFGFSILARNIETLAETTFEKLKKIGTDISTLKSNIEQSHISISGSIKIYKDELSHLQEESLQLLKNFIDTRHQNEILSRNFNDEFLKLKDNFSNIVVSIQFHDIIRQQLEHISENIDDAIIRINSEKSDSDNIPFLLHFIKEVLVLEESQFINSNQEFKDDALKMQDNFYNIRTLIKDHLQNLSHIKSDLLEAKELESLKKNIYTIISLEDSTYKNLSFLAENINNFSNILNNLIDFIKDIKDIAEDITLIAYNAEVKATHLGSEGKVIAVLATEIREMSIKTTTEVKNVKLMITSLNENSQNILNNSNKVELINKEQLYFIDKFKISTNYFEEINNATAKSFLDAELSCAKILQNVEHIIKKFDAFKIILQKFTDIRQEKAQLIKSITQILPNISEKKYSEHFDKVLDKYTMEKERKVHLNSHSPDKEDQSVDIDSNSNVDNSPSGSDTDFGDNVELF